MSKNFIKKNIKLSLELDKYLAKHPDGFDKIPDKSCLIITVKGDDEFNRGSMAIAKSAGEKKQRFIEARKEGMRWVFEPIFT